MALLVAENLSVSFGGLKAVDRFHLKIEKGQLYGLIGPNGAGKSTVFNLLTGVYKPETGVFYLDHEKLSGKSTAEISRKGIARTFQNIRLFSNLSVLDNVKAAMNGKNPYSVFSAALRLPAYWHGEERTQRLALELLEVLHWKRQRMIWHKTFRMASSASLKLHVRWQRSPSFCCLTSRRQG